MKYHCKVCNYRTKYSGNYCNHKKTQKHVRNLAGHEKFLKLAQKLEKKKTKI